MSDLTFTDLAMRQIRRFRETSGISNRKLARLAGVTEQAIRRLDGDPRLSTIRRIEDAMRKQALDQMRADISKWGAKWVGKNRE